MNRIIVTKKNCIESKWIFCCAHSLRLSFWLLFFTFTSSLATPFLCTFLLLDFIWSQRSAWKCHCVICSTWRFLFAFRSTRGGLRFCAHQMSARFILAHHLLPVTVSVCLVLRTFCAKFNLLVSHHVYDSLQLLGYWNSDGKDHIGFVLLTIDSTKIQPLRLEWTYISHSMIIIMINTKDLQKRRKN